jgi:membrane fusion protein, copper/silver efflux system
MSIHRIPISIAIAWAALLAGCDRTSVEKEPSVQSATSKDTANTNASKSALARYESIRASLAKDDIGAATAGAKSLESSARSAAAEATGAAKQQWTEVAKAAARLSALPKDDADAVRKAFGNVSEALILLLKADTELAEGLFVFECPMAQGYDKWVQPAPKLENPYMGTKMLECGSKSTL